MNTVTSYYKQILGYLQGDNAKVVAAKNERKANSAVQSQLAALRSKLVDDESRVEDMEEAMNKAFYPTDLITSNQSYISNIVRTKENLDNANETVETTKKSIAYFEQLLKDFSQQVAGE